MWHRHNPPCMVVAPDGCGYELQCMQRCVRSCTVAAPCSFMHRTRQFGLCCSLQVNTPQHQDNHLAPALQQQHQAARATQQLRRQRQQL